MASLTTKNSVLVGVIAVLALYVVYQYDNSLFGLLGRREGFAATDGPVTSSTPKKDTTAPTVTTPATTSTSTTGTGAAANMATMPTTTTTGTATTTAPTPVTSTFVGGSKEGFADLASMEGPAAFASAEAPAGCYPRAQLTPVELLPADQHSIYAQQNPMGTGSLKGKNFLSAGALIGVNTVGQSLRNANLQLRSEPPNPQTPVSIFNQATIGPDISHRPLDVGS
jgi:hypothetical protein